METQEAVELAEHDNIIARDGSNLEKLTQNYLLGQAALEELVQLKPVLALAISKLPKGQLKVSLSDRAKLGELALQMKVETKSGAIWFRAVKSVD